MSRRNAVSTASRVITDTLTTCRNSESRVWRDDCKQLTLPAWQCDALLFLRPTVKHSTTESHDTSTCPPRSLIRSPVSIRAAQEFLAFELFEIRFQLRSFVMAKIHQWRKMNFSPFIPCFSDHLTFVSDFRQLPCQYLFKFFSLLSYAALANGICERIVLRHGAIFLVVRGWSGFNPQRWSHCGSCAGQRTG